MATNVYELFTIWFGAVVLAIILNFKGTLSWILLKMFYRQLSPKD